MTLDQLFYGAGVVLAVMPHVAALIGTPAWLAKIGAAQGIYNVLAGNYSKAKNEKQVKGWARPERARFDELL
jgi:hypothetical protein